MRRNRMAVPTPLPRWDLTPIFPALDSPQFQAAFEKLKQQIARLPALFDEHGVRRREASGVEPSEVRALQAVVGCLNGLLRELETLSSYLGCHVATDAANDLAQSLLSELQM